AKRAAADRAAGSGGAGGASYGSHSSHALSRSGTTPGMGGGAAAVLAAQQVASAGADRPGAFSVTGGGSASVVADAKEASLRRMEESKTGGDGFKYGPRDVYGSGGDKIYASGDYHDKGNDDEHSGRFHQRGGGDGDEYSGQYSGAWIPSVIGSGAGPDELIAMERGRVAGTVPITAGERLRLLWSSEETYRMHPPHAEIIVLLLCFQGAATAQASLLDRGCTPWTVAVGVALWVLFPCLLLLFVWQFVVARVRAEGAVLVYVRDDADAGVTVAGMRRIGSGGSRHSLGYGEDRMNQEQSVSTTTGERSGPSGGSGG
ncbi:unnamed protein product, partial [Phaeothamnion confervicola]